MQNKKSILTVLILLLVIVVPLTVFSAYLHFSGYKTTTSDSKTSDVVNPTPTTPSNNTNNSKYQDGILYFYDKNNNQIGTYTCKQDPCSYATSLIDDQRYSIDYLVNEEAEIDVILDKYAFINDNNQVYLYDILNSNVIGTYKAVKNYNNMTDPTIMIVEDDHDMWGVIKIGETIETIVNNQYDFVGLINKLNEDNLLDNEYFIVKNSKSWAVVDDSGALMTNYVTNEISSFNGILVSLKSGNIYYLYDREGNRVVDENGFNYVSFTDRFVNIVDKNNNLYVYEYGTNNRRIGNVTKLDTNDYKTAFTSTYNDETKVITVTVNGQEYILEVKD